MTTSSDFPASVLSSRKDDLPDEIVVECDLPDAPKKVWRALTVPELLGAWLMPNDIRPRVGEHFRFHPSRSQVAADAPREGAEPPAQEQELPRGCIESPVDCEVLEADPERLLRYRWRTREDEGRRERRLDSVVSFELTPTANGGTHLRIVHGEFRVAHIIRLPARKTTAAANQTGKGPVALAGVQTPARGGSGQSGPWSTACVPGGLRRAA